MTVTHCRWNHEYTPENTVIGKDGKRRCRECARERGRRRPVSDARKQYLKDYQRGWAAKRRAAYLADKACVECGSRDRMEIDHIDPKLKVSHRIWTWSEKRRIEELAKCQVLCHVCHLAKTIRDRPDHCSEGHRLVCYPNTGRRKCPTCNSNRMRMTRHQLQG